MGSKRACHRKQSLYHSGFEAANCQEAAVSRLPFTSPPRHLCLVRLSALGDISHTLPLLRRLQQQWPKCRISWIIGKTEYQLVKSIAEVEWIVFDKKGGWRSYTSLWHQLQHYQFDAILHLQMSIRASLIVARLNSPIKLGFDRQRAKDMQWLFTNHTIAYRPRQHVVESLLEFATALGVAPSLAPLQWRLPIGADAAAWFTSLTLRPLATQPLVVVSPCASKAQRNWLIDRYAAVIDHLQHHYGVQVVLSGGGSDTERHYGEAISRLCTLTPLNLIGQTSIQQLLYLLAQASVVIAPDSGPAHLATAVGTPVIGLYAATNPDRARPYLSQQWLVNRYPEAVEQFLGRQPHKVRWGQRVNHPEAMALISVAEVLARFEQLSQTALHYR
ncbi:lipopolysaccharide heptosyltransferase family protein [Ectothiorhodospiraceae bacterium BW-2]|nr:lipopolysaccharide heptosyltransferase family protein [Ectothiorhodospiraceae bacterium BW-2]